MTPEKINRIRAEMPVTEKVAYLNTGTSGPLPKQTVDILTAENTRQLTEGRADMAGGCTQRKLNCGKHLPI